MDTPNVYSVSIHFVEGLFPGGEVLSVSGCCFAQVAPFAAPGPFTTLTPSRSVTRRSSVSPVARLSL